MCYDIKASLESQLNRARRKNDLKAIEEIIQKLIPLTDLPIYHASGFNHPKLLIYTSESPYFPDVAIWGLIPHWVKNEEQQKKLWNNTLNARGETIFEKPSFRDAARHNRCIVYLDGFYEHHHYKGKTYPFFIHDKSNQPLALAGIWSEWNDPETGEILTTFSIVTTKGNALMTKVHNNPKLSGPRMPLLLTPDVENEWLKPIHNEIDMKRSEELINSHPEVDLEAYTVNRLRGKSYLGNVRETSQKVIYDELSY